MVSLNRVSISIDNFALMDVSDQPSAGGPFVPSLVYCVFQLMFAAITCVISALTKDVTVYTAPA